MEASTPAAQPSRPPLYHYSDAGGFLGMLSSRSLWFTHIKYLNDAQEWFYALDLFEQVLQEYDNYSAFSSAYYIVKERPYLQDHFTFSFSEQEDLLSQWRGYCPHGGYSFCLDDLHLDQMIQEHDLVLERCLYEEEEQKEFIRTRIICIRPEVLAKVLAEEAERMTRGENVHSIGRELHENITTMVSRFSLLCLLKHHTFEQEREWRMIKSSRGKSRIKLRPSRNMLIPYLDLSIPIEQDAPDESHPDTPRYYRWNIKEVIVSPHPHQELAIAACKLAIPEYIGNYVGAVTASAIPYVNW